MQKKYTIISAAIVAGLAIVALTGNPGIPYCDSSDARLTLMRAFDGSPAAKLSGLTAVHAHDASQVSRAEDGSFASCKATITLNSSEELPVKYEMKLTDDGSYLLTFAVAD